MAQKSALGKGLASLLPGATREQIPESKKKVETPPEESNHDRHPGISLAKLSDIQVNPYQPRRDFDESAIAELSASIKTNGVIQPLIVRKTAKGYQLIAGERRLRAATQAGLEFVPVVIRKSTDRESLEIALIENIQRQDLNCIDEAMAYFQLMQEFALTQEEVAERVGKERTTVANHLRLLKLPEVIITDLKNQELSFGHGKVILGLNDSQEQIRLRNEILENKLSVRATEAWVQAKKKEASSPDSAKPSKPATPLEERLGNLSQDLTRHWSAKVQIRGNDKKGKIVIHYATRDELERIVQGMQNDKLWAEQSH